MSKLIIALCTAVLFVGCGESPQNTPRPDSAINTQDMTQFNKDLGVFMTQEIAPIGTVTADCAPLKDGKTNCKILIKTEEGDDNGTAENVRRVGKKFVWDHES